MSVTRFNHKKETSRHFYLFIKQVPYKYQINGNDLDGIVTISLP